MKISVAQALKEKKRLTGEIAFMWQLFQNENSVYEGHTRSINPKKMLQQIDHFTAKLIELKTKISLANQGEHLQNMQRLEAAKKQLKELSSVNGSTDTEETLVFQRPVEKKRTAIFDENELNKMRRRLQHEIDTLQDKLDAHNAKTQIDFETPLQ